MKMHYLNFLRLVRKAPTTISEAEAASVQSATARGLNGVFGVTMNRLSVFGDGTNVTAVVVTGFLITGCFGLLAYLLGSENGELWSRICFAALVVLSIGGIRQTRIRRAQELSGLIAEREDEACARALLVCEESPGASNYRKNILSRNEPIRYFHYLHMMVIAEAERDAANLAEEERQEAVFQKHRKVSCQKLHEIT